MTRHSALSWTVSFGIVGALASAAFLACGSSSNGGGCGSGFVDQSDELADGNLGAFGNLEGDAAGGFGLAFGGDFVRFQFKERLAAGDDGAVLDVPLGQDAAGD